MKIYVVTRGEYSDYHIITATTDKSVAEKVARKISDLSRYYSADAEVYEKAELYLKTGWRVVFDGHGCVSSISEFNSEYQYEDIGNIYPSRNGFLEVYVSADDEKAAIKIAAERRAKYLAQKEGL
jgi:hypothetical protein